MELQLSISSLIGMLDVQLNLHFAPSESESRKIKSLMLSAEDVVRKTWQISQPDCRVRSFDGDYEPRRVITPTLIGAIINLTPLTGHPEQNRWPILPPLTLRGATTRLNVCRSRQMTCRMEHGRKL